MALACTYSAFSTSISFGTVCEAEQSRVDRCQRFCCHMCVKRAIPIFFLFDSVIDHFTSEAELFPGPDLNVYCTAQVDLGAELLHGDQTSLFRLAEEKGWEMEELISLAQGDGGPLPADSNDGWGLFYVGSEKRMLALDSKVPATKLCALCSRRRSRERQVARSEMG